MKIIITGAYAIGKHLANLLSHTGEDITLIDNDAERLARVGQDLDVLTMQAAPTDIDTLKAAGAHSADLFAAVGPDENENLLACILAHSLGAKKTVAKIDSAFHARQERRKAFVSLGVDSIIYPEELAAQDINNGLKMSWVRQRWDVQTPGKSDPDEPASDNNCALTLLGIKLREGCEILNQPLKDLCGPNDPYHVVAIKRGSETLIPGGNDCLKLYDLAYMMTTRQYIPYVRKIVGKENYADVKNVMIMGGGQTAVRAVETMPEYMYVKIFEADAARCERLGDLITRENTLVINGDGRDIPLLMEEGIKNTQAFVALTANAETNILACLTAKRLGVRKTVAMVENMDYVAMAESLDIGTIINKKAIAASHIYQMLLDADVSNVRTLMMANADVAAFTAEKGSTVTKKKVYELGLPTGVTIGGLVRGGKGQLVSGGTQIEAGDTVMVFCHNVNMKKVEKYFT